MLTRTGRKILDHNLASLIRMDPSTPSVLEEVVLDIHEYPQIVAQQIISHRYFNELLYGILRIMDAHTPKNPRVAGNAAYILGALLECDQGREKTIELIKDPNKVEDTQHLLPNLAALIEIYDLEPQTNASGTTALIFEIEESREWALEQPSCEWLIFILGRCLMDTDMWVASNCALTLARICMSEVGIQKVLNHKDLELILVQLIMAVGVDNEGRGMNAAYAMAYICETEEGMKKIAYMKECLDLILGLINMLRSVDEGCRKNSAFCLKTMSTWEDGQDRINDDPDIDHLLKLLCNLLTCGDEDLGKLASVILKNLTTKKEGYMLQKDHAPTKTTLEHVLKQMNISENYRKDAFEALKELMVPKPAAPQLKVLDAYTISAVWETVESKSGAEVHYELYCDDNVVYKGNQTTFTARSLKERTDYEFRVRAYTNDDEESFISEGSIIQTFRAVSSVPRNLRAVSVTASTIKIVWDKPTKVCGNLKGYYVQEQGSSIRYEPVYLYHIASNLEADKEYTFEVCAVTQRGRGQAAELNVRTLRNDYFAPTKPKVITVGSHEMCIVWKPPVAPPGRINGYEVMCNGKSIYFGMNKRCIADKLQPKTKYKFTVVAWTSEGRTESQSTVKKTSAGYKSKAKNQPWKTREELMEWLNSKDDIDSDLGEASDDGETTARTTHGNEVASTQQDDVEEKRDEDARPNTYDVKDDDTNDGDDEAVDEEEGDADPEEEEEEEEAAEEEEGGEEEEDGEDEEKEEEEEEETDDTEVDDNKSKAYRM